MTNNPETSEETLRRRVNRLQYLTDRFQGRWSAVIETEIYLILESQQTRRQILWRFLYYYGSVTWGNWGFNFHWYRRLWWYRYARGWPHERVMIFFEEEVAGGDENLLQVIRDQYQQGDDDGDSKESDTV